jgi:SAM-dependent methyltransferase
MLHRDRGRAGSFGAFAREYDRYRPDYPDALIDDLVEPCPAAVLDVGCGTGKAAAALAVRGLPVLGVEPDQRMAEVARSHGIAVEVATFEDWAAAGRTFELLTCGDAWHWIDPGRGVAKAAEVLAEGGVVARFWNTSILSEPVVAAFEEVYRRHAPDVPRVWRPSRDSPRFHASGPDPFAHCAAFGPTELRTFPWQRSVRTAEWLGYVSTFSGHQRLGPARLERLLEALGAAIDELGGTIHPQHETYALVNRRL